MLLGDLESPNRTARAAETLLKRGKEEPRVRKYLAGHLPAMIDKGPDGAPEAWTSMVRLAGELRMAEAAGALARWLDVWGGEGSITLTQEVRLEDKPAGKALAQIGDPAIPSLVGVLKHGRLNQRWTATFALYDMNSPAARKALEEHLRRETDRTLRDFIKKARK